VDDNDSTINLKVVLYKYKHKLEKQLRNFVPSATSIGADIVGTGRPSGTSTMIKSIVVLAFTTPILCLQLLHV
jgi:hypothetical protein